MCAQRENCRLTHHSRIARPLHKEPIFVDTAEERRRHTKVQLEFVSLGARAPWRSENLRSCIEKTMISRIWLVSGCGRDYSGVSMSEEENRKPRVGARATQTSAHDFRASLRSRKSTSPRLRSLATILTLLNVKH